VEAAFNVRIAGGAWGVLHHRLASLSWLVRSSWQASARAGTFPGFAGLYSKPG